MPWLLPRYTPSTCDSRWSCPHGQAGLDTYPSSFAPFSRPNQPHPVDVVADDFNILRKKICIAADEAELVLTLDVRALIPNLGSETESELCIEALDRVGPGSFTYNHRYAVPGGGRLRVMFPLTPSLGCLPSATATNASPHPSCPSLIIDRPHHV
jgi:hypothetical protein